MVLEIELNPVSVVDALGVLDHDKLNKRVRHSVVLIIIRVATTATIGSVLAQFEVKIFDQPVFLTFNTKAVLFFEVQKRLLNLII